MFVFILIFFGVNFLATVGYSDIFGLNSDRKLFTYFWITAIVPFILFYTVLDIMGTLIISVLIYEVLGVILYLGQCRKYNREKENQKESW